MPKEIEQGGESEDGSNFSRRDFLKFIPSTLIGMAGGAILSENNPQGNVNIWERPLPIPDSKSNRFLLIADTHIGLSDDGERQNNTKSLGVLKNVLTHLYNYPFDMVVQMGDLIRQTADEKLNIINYETSLKAFKEFSTPTIHLLGNHDVWGISQASLSKIKQRYDLSPFWGIKEYKDYQVVWLDMEAKSGAPGTLAEERVDWLKNSVIYKDTPTFIFSHYSLLPQDVDGSYYFNGDSNLSALTNGPKVWESLKGLPVNAVISGHMHWIGYSQIDKTHMLTVPAFVENMMSADQSENPGVYSILEVDYPNKFVLKSYFGSICISRTQITL